MEENNFFLFITSERGKSVANEILSPLQKHPNIRVIENNVLIKNRIIKRIYQLHYGPLRRLPGHCIWGAKPFNYLEHFEFCEGIQYYIIFFSSGYNSVNREMIKRIKNQNSNVKLVLILWDPVLKRPSRKAFKDRDIFDVVFTTEKADADQYDFEYFFQVYSFEKSLYSETNELDLYFCGRDKGRRELISRVYKKMKSLGANNCRFEMLGKVSGESSDEGMRFFEKKRPYDDLLKNAVKSKAILEILQPDQESTTLRYCEAVCYNKILLTNNHRICSCPYYNPQYMHVFDDADEIKPEWFECDKVDYKYDGGFEPEVLLGKITAFFSRKEE